MAAISISIVVAAEKYAVAQAGVFRCSDQRFHGFNDPPPKMCVATARAARTRPHLRCRFCGIPIAMMVVGKPVKPASVAIRIPDPIRTPAHTDNRPINIFIFFTFIFNRYAQAQQRARPSQRSGPAWDGAWMTQAVFSSLASTVLALSLCQARQCGPWVLLCVFRGA